MAGLGNTQEDQVLDCYFNQTNITAPTAIYLSWHSADPGDTGANELTGNGYARVDVTTSFGAASGGTVANNATITGPTASGNWTAATHFGIWSALSGGTWIAGGTLTAPVTITTGGYYSIGIGQLTYTCD